MECGPFRLVDPDGMKGDDWVKIDNEYIWDDRVINQSSAESYHGKEARYIGEAAEITSRTVDGNIVGSAINLNSDGTITRDGVTLCQNSDQIFTNATGSEFKPRQTGGYFMGLSVNGPLLGGFGYGGGMITDATGNSSAYFTFNGKAEYWSGFWYNEAIWFKSILFK